MKDGRHEIGMQEGEMQKGGMIRGGRVRRKEDMRGGGRRVASWPNTL
jgi:hypothetical protein